MGYQELTALFRKHVNKMLEENKVNVLDRMPEGLKLIAYQMGFTRQTITEMGEENIMKTLASSIMHIIFENYSEEMKAGNNPHYSIYFRDEPSITGDHIPEIFVYKAMCRFGSIISARDKLSDYTAANDASATPLTQNKMVSDAS